jgi:hypothetical protein
MYWNFVAIDGVIKNQLDDHRSSLAVPLFLWDFLAQCSYFETIEGGIAYSRTLAASAKCVQRDPRVPTDKTSLFHHLRKEIDSVSETFCFLVIQNSGRGTQWSRIKRGLWHHLDLCLFLSPIYLFYERKICFMSCGPFHVIFMWFSRTLTSPDGEFNFQCGGETLNHFCVMHRLNSDGLLCCSMVPVSSTSLPGFINCARFDASAIWLMVTSIAESGVLDRGQVSVIMNVRRHNLNFMFVTAVVFSIKVHGGCWTAGTNIQKICLAVTLTIHIQEVIGL